MTPGTLPAADLLEQLRAAGYVLTPREPDRIHCKYVGEGDPPREAGPLLEALKARKPEALAILAGATWNEERARRRLEAAWSWADRTTPSGCWAALPAAVRRDLQADLDHAFDRIDQAFADQNPTGFEDGIDRFRTVVLAAANEHSKNESDRADDA